MMKELGKLKIEKGYIFSIRNFDIVTNMTRYSDKQVKEILIKANKKAKILRLSDKQILESKTLSNELKSYGSIAKNIRIEFQEWNLPQFEKESYDKVQYSLHTETMGRGDDIKKLVIVML